jgi:hypothetical protein
MAFKDGKDVRLVSRNQKAFDYPQLLDALKLLPADRVILDDQLCEESFTTAVSPANV